MNEPCNAPGARDLGTLHTNKMGNVSPVHQWNAFFRSFVEDLAASWSQVQSTEGDRCCTGGVTFIHGELLHLHPVPSRAAQAAGAISAFGAKDCKAD